MKTNCSFYVAAVAVSALAMSLLMGCSEKNKPVAPPVPVQDQKPVAASILMQVNFDPKTIEMCDISFDYYDENGVKKNEVVTSAKWEKNVKSKDLPATLGFHWNLAVKADLDTTKYEKFLVAYECNYFSVAVNAEGAAVTNKEGSTFSNHLEMAMKKRESVVETIMKNNPINFVHEYNAEGKCNYGSWK